MVESVRSNAHLFGGAAERRFASMGTAPRSVQRASIGSIRACARPISGGGTDEKSNARKSRATALPGHCFGLPDTSSEYFVAPLHRSRYVYFMSSVAPVSILLSTVPGTVNATLYSSIIVPSAI